MATSDLVDLTECHNNIHFVPQSSERKRQDWLPILMDYRTRIRVIVLLGEKVQFPYAGHDSQANGEGIACHERRRRRGSIKETRM